MLDARSVATPTDLASVRAFLAPAVKALGRGARVLVLGTPPDGQDVATDATRQALDGIVRSLAKELRHGATANLLWVRGRGIAAGRAAVLPVRPLGLRRRAAAAARAGGGARRRRTGSSRWPARPPWSPAPPAASAPRSPACWLATARHVVAADLAAAGEALAKVANSIGGSALHLDVAAPDAPEKLLAHLAEHTGGLDILVHNAGITRDKLMANMKPEQWDSVIAVNLQSQLAINAALLDSDQLNEQARVVSLSSTTGFAGNRGQTNYGATKAGVIGMVRSSAAAFAGHGDSTINAVAPGFIDTEMTARMPLATREVARRLSSLQQAGLPVDVAEAVSWLASPGAGGVNGQVLRVCGQNLVGA